MLRKWANWFGLKYEQVDKKEASATSNPDELYKYNTCSKEFNCGNITGVSYPFWGSDRPLGCGHLDLQLNCHDGIATIEIMGVNYRVLSFNKDAQTLRIARQDYLKGICSPLLVNTTLDPKLFDYAAVYHWDSSEGWLLRSFTAASGPWTMQSCSECLESKGVCGYDLGLNQTTCYCKDQLQASKTCGSPTGEGPSPESSPPSTYLNVMFLGQCFISYS
ncbi:Leaf rust 10 disease-resistance locus receptor-like protein kinase-like 1.1-like 2.4 [Vitis vinifera]|uniref:non-specific serine/threonine protein kinase n=1 Tax=Vitis vinifera TaxID=29760 RepID=A0A438FHW3_VITVI|nr:Leaf rust 10 disease-resistance locus receptor-like protein kinase-like 1.1-like 2.4 [Vitis vinifera]